MEYKGYMLVALGSFPMVEIKSKGSGKVPVALTGLYTTMSSAQAGVDMYLNSLVKGKSNGKAKDRSTG